MSSSTSSSRKIYFKIWLVCALGMALAMALIRLFTFAIGVKGENFISRVLEAQHALPVITAEPYDQVMVFGSSMVDAGFSPRQFDRDLGELGVKVKSYNFGFGGLNPFFQDYVARRIKEQYVNNNKRLKLAVIEFNPFQTTTTRWKGAEPAVDGYLSMLASSDELADIFWDDPTRGLRILNIKHLRDNISAEMITFFFGRGFHPGRPKPDVEPLTEEQVQRQKALRKELIKRFKDEFPDYVDQDWDLDWQGGGLMPEERAPETLEIFKQYYESRRSEYHLLSDKLWREHSADITDLNFEEGLIEGFIRTVKQFQQFSDKVEVILLPKNSAWIQNPPEALERQRQVVARIRAETGVTVRDFQHASDITPEMFSDTTHLAGYFGDVVFTQMLLETYAPYLTDVTPKQQIKAKED